MRSKEVIRLLLATFVRPAEETGTGASRLEAVYGYLIRHRDGLVLLDTGLGEGDTETESWYRPQRIALPDALAECGVRRQELATAEAGGYTMEHLIRYPGARYEQLDGESDIRAVRPVQPLPQAPAWMERLLAFDPRRVVFAHDAAVCGSPREAGMTVVRLRAAP
jgi:N-acyl homoserine lactone hydrolase